MTRRYDLQVHTDASPCSSASPENVVTAATAAGLDGLVVTDHDTVANVAAVRARAPPTLEVISGVEVTTTQGHLLALGVEDAHHVISGADRDTKLRQGRNLAGVVIDVAGISLDVVDEYALTVHRHPADESLA